LEVLMSFDVELCDPVTGEVLHTDQPHHMRGGTYQMGGSTELRLNITYNYAKHLFRVLPIVVEEKNKGLRGLDGMTGAASLPLFAQAVAQLGDDKSDYYWDPTEGNVKAALLQLTALATMRPDGVWRVE
jgi:hypothetical protein